MSYRPITDFWLLTRCKYKGGVKRFGGYLGGFPERARALLGVTVDDPVLHVCGGLARLYPYRGGFGPNDKTVDLDRMTEPDFVVDVSSHPIPFTPSGNLWPAILADPPYSPEDAAHYEPGSALYPKPNDLLRKCLTAVRPGGRVGMIHYILPSPPKNTRFVAAVGVLCGFNNRIRIYSVFEKSHEI